MQLYLTLGLPMIDDQNKKGNIYFHSLWHWIVYYIPLISQVRGLYSKLWTEFFSFLLWPKCEACGPWKQGREKRGSITCSTDGANEANKIFIIWLCWLFQLEVRTATYGPGIDQSQNAKSVSHVIMANIENWRLLEADTAVVWLDNLDDPNSTRFNITLIPHVSTVLSQTNEPLNQMHLAVLMIFVSTFLMQMIVSVANILHN